MTHLPYWCKLFLQEAQQKQTLYLLLWEGCNVSTHMITYGQPAQLQQYTVQVVSPCYMITLMLLDVEMHMELKRNSKTQLMPSPQDNIIIMSLDASYKLGLKPIWLIMILKANITNNHKYSLYLKKKEAKHFPQSLNYLQRENFH